MTLLELLEAEGIPYERHRHPATLSAQQLAQCEHLPGWNIAKPVVVRDETGFTLCVVPAPARIDLAAVADALCVDRVELAHEQELSGLFPGCELGAQPPIGPLYGLPTLVDYSLLDGDYVVFQAGSHTESIRVARSDFERLAQPKYARIAALPAAKT
ncbi:MAG TPA: YbaK/EbsC family protein [Phycisphaerae bacterium]|nr:YbaK/EbsC family protein [Phycisphaerae bacterium]HNU44310.1 YbaK/EbsC family protein [Phycisphaerae bacterium]